MTQRRRRRRDPVNTDAREFPTEAFADRFELVQTFRGGEGATALLRHKRTGKELIAKVLDADVPAAEASLLLSLQHPAIPAVREVGQVPDGRVFLLREYARGRPLAQQLPLPPERAIALAQQVLEVLAFVHLRGVLHLDLKPANLVLGDAGEVALLDFGLAVRRGRQGAGGTPFFASPEVLLGGTPDQRSDLFSLGAVLVAAMWPGSGQLPLARFLRAFPTRSFWEAADVAPGDFPAPFPQFLERCMSRRPARRFADAQAALEFLVGGAGRPSRSLLQPDLVALFGRDLDAAVRSTQGRGDLVLTGGSAIELEQLALHLLCTVRDVRSYRVDGDRVRVVRDGGEPLTWELPPLDGARLVPFLREVLGLAEDTAAVAAAHLLKEVGPSAAAIGYELVRRAADGHLVPDGTRWSWPAAAQGRLGETPPVEVGPATPENLRAHAAEGRGDLALQLFARATRTAKPEEERALRRSLAQGLLTAGEPARALPLCVDLPSERAQALFDLGRIDDARAALAAAMAEPHDARGERDLARTAARIRAAGGEVEAALGDLRAAVGDEPEPVETQVLAALHEQLGHGEIARSLLAALLPKVPETSAPFVRAAVLTSLGLAERRLGHQDDAHTCFADARALLLRLGHARHAATATHNLGLAAKDIGRLDEATEHLRQARGLFQHIGDHGSAAIAEAALGNVALTAGDPVAAERRLEPAMRALDDLGAHAAASHTRVLLMRALALQGRREEAQQLLASLDERTAARFANEIAAVRALLERPTEPSPPPLPVPKPRPAPVQDPQGPSRELFRTFLAVNRRLAHESDLEKAMAMLLDSAITLTGGRTGYLLVARPDGLRREFESGQTGPGGHAFSRSLANRAMQLQRTLTGEDALADRELQEMPSIRNLQVRSAICAPFQSGTGAEGAIYVEHSGRAGAFSEGDKESLEVLADQAAIAVDRMLREEQLAQELEHSRRELAVAQRVVRRDQGTLIGDSPVMRDLRTQIQKIAPLDLSVLVLGETGTGKELVARAIHQSGTRSRGPFVAENCSALPAELMERELFGHVAGSFTGADRDRPGLLELASGGTLFLDEVGDMPAALQAKLLRALQEKKIRRIGGSETVSVDVRILAATHKNLRAMVDAGDFREDLFFRLAGVEIAVPPLRDRKGDVDVLARHFLGQLCREHGVQRAFSDGALAQMRSYRWPGNVRELQHVVARALLLAEGDEIDDLQLPRLAPTDAAPDGGAPAAAAARAEPVEAPWPAIPLAEAERRTILAALEHCGGEKSAASRLLGISRTALYEKLKRYDAFKPS
ncbi:MAG: sigma 54-interacting transcriptional regulator [Planctomycetota bacterium]